MQARRVGPTGVRWISGALAFAAGVYAAKAAITWLRYGCARPPSPLERDSLLDSFMPRYDVVDRMQVDVKAPAEITLATAEQQDLMNAPGVSAIFRARQVVMGAGFEMRELPKPLLEQVKALGWVELARVPEREVVLGAVTQPWKGDVTFRSVAPERFAAFAEPGYVKIAWTLRADPLGSNASRFRSETRAIATDEESRQRFRNYWSLVAPGVWLIRRLSSAPMRRRAEREALMA
ncbi:MAG TPA: hypothetical protein VM791_04495 [Vicinamibacterales bacterium]|jgi:hypothetical protein|nr:hypothetical protein [Vicinamibacterales bacterium]